MPKYQFEPKSIDNATLAMAKTQGFLEAVNSFTTINLEWHRDQMSELISELEKARYDLTFNGKYVSSED